ncbi:MAG: ubiquinol oxidase subunit II [Proteobacteria bacterium]|nr:ubiquinol oxidase subunit II [Pseudomonadota bacterium]
MARANKLVAVSALLPLLAGCDKGILAPRGPVGAAEKLILIDSLVIMFAIVIPVIIMVFAFAWWYRASNTRATYRPNWAFSGHLELIVWAIPALVIIFLGGIAWFGSQQLDPFQRLPGKGKAVEIQVVSLDWKWLFIYPEEHVATVNTLVIPVGTPVHFDLTSSSVMNSFFVPQLGSQIYTMAGMTSQLNLQADHPGEYEGLSAQFSGAGFAGMRFKAHAVSADDYAKWLAQTRANGPVLDKQSYLQLQEPSSHVAPMTYRDVAPGLFRDIVNQAYGPPPGPRGGVGGHDLPPAEKGS